jgi:hypothetical protein
MGVARELSAALSVQPREFRHWTGLAEFMDPDRHPAVLESYAGMGSAILKAQAHHVDSLASRATLADVGGHAVPVVNSPLFQSELGEELCRRFPAAPFGAVYSLPTPGREVWSLRSRNGFDVSAVARSLGGGGHRGAAGFERNR